jgi:hypothetical protein
MVVQILHELPLQVSHAACENSADVWNALPLFDEVTPCLAVIYNIAVFLCGMFQQ